MRPSEALEQNRAAIRDVVRHSKAFNPRVFGSALLGTDTERSDLDILVDAMPGTTLFDLGNLLFELETLLDTQVDLLTPGDLPETFRASVVAEAQPV